MLKLGQDDCSGLALPTAGWALPHQCINKLCCGKFVQCVKMYSVIVVIELNGQ